MTTSASTSEKIWQTLLPAGTKPQRIAFIGVGNALNGDDAAGVHFVRLMRNMERDEHKQPAVFFIEGGTAPENFTGVIRKFQPQLVVIVDAALMGMEAGQMAVLDPSEIEGISASTHTFPLSLLASYLEHEIDGCQVKMVGIQMAASEPLTAISPVVAEAVEDLADALRKRLLAE